MLSDFVKLNLLFDFEVDLLLKTIDLSRYSRGFWSEGELCDTRLEGQFWIFFALLGFSSL